MGTDGHDEDEEGYDTDDGGREADSEYIDFRTKMGWTSASASDRNVSVRKKSGSHSSRGSSSALGLEDGFGRRHSMAV